MQEHPCCHHHSGGHHCCCHNHMAHYAACCGGHVPDEITLTRAQAEFLVRFSQSPFLPLCRFLMLSSKEDELESVGLSPVFLDGDEDLPTAKETGRLLESLAELGLITLDYDVPLSNYDYAEYENAALFAQFRQTVSEGAHRPNFLFDTPVLGKGSMALTHLGIAVMERVLELLQ